MLSLFLRRDVLLVLLSLSMLGVRPSPAAAAAATVTVDSVADDAATDGRCTLREALLATNTNTAVDSCASGSEAGTDVVAWDPR